MPDILKVAGIILCQFKTEYAFLQRFDGFGNIFPCEMVLRSLFLSIVAQVHCNGSKFIGKSSSNSRYNFAIGTAQFLTDAVPYGLRGYIFILKIKNWRGNYFIQLREKLIPDLPPYRGVIATLAISFGNVEQSYEVFVVVGRLSDASYAKDYLTGGAFLRKIQGFPVKPLLD